MLAEEVKDRAAAFDIGGRAGRNDEQLTSLRRIWIPEHRCRDITLAGLEVLSCELGCGRGTDRAHGEMNGAGGEAEGETV